MQHEVTVLLNLFKQAGLEKSFQELSLLKQKLEKSPWSNDARYQVLANELLDATIAVCLKWQDPEIAQKNKNFNKARDRINKEEMNIKGAAYEIAHPQLVKERDALNNKIKDIHQKISQGRVDSKQADEELRNILKRLEKVGRKLQNSLPAEVKEKLNNLNKQYADLMRQQANLLKQEAIARDKINDELRASSTRPCSFIQIKLI